MLGGGRAADCTTRGLRAASSSPGRGHAASPRLHKQTLGCVTMHPLRRPAPPPHNPTGLPRCSTGRQNHEQMLVCQHSKTITGHRVKGSGKSPSALRRFRQPLGEVEPVSEPGLCVQGESADQPLSAKDSAKPD